MFCIDVDAGNVGVVAAEVDEDTLELVAGFEGLLEPDVDDRDEIMEDCDVEDEVGVVVELLFTMNSAPLLKFSDPYARLKWKPSEIGRLSIVVGVQT